MEDLSERTKVVIEDIVREFIAFGAPVSSERIARKGRTKLSSASLRNIMNELEGDGYLVKPHTSAGRVPTDKAYRHYVNSIIGEAAPQSSAEIYETKLDRKGDMENLLISASSLLADLTRNVGVVKAPDIASAVLQHIEFVSLSPATVLAVIVTKNNYVQNKIVNVQYPYTPDELQKMSNLLKEQFLGFTLREIQKKLLSLMASDRARYDKLLKNAMELGDACLRDASSNEDIYLEGAANLLNKEKDFSESEMRSLFEAFEQKRRIVELLADCIENKGVTVIIGSENKEKALRHASLIVTSYGSDTGERGLLGVIGPTRMDYVKVIDVVQDIAHCINQTIRKE